MGGETEARRDYRIAPGYKGQSWQVSLGSLTPEPVLLTIILSSLCKRNHKGAKLCLAGSGSGCVPSFRGGGGGEKGNIGQRGIFLEWLASEQNLKRLCGEGSLRFILHAVDQVWGALQPAVPRQDVFEVAGLEFYVLKKI